MDSLVPWLFLLTHLTGLRSHLFWQPHPRRGPTAAPYCKPPSLEWGPSWGGAHMAHVWNSVRPGPWQVCNQC